jgi:hypothetical protein
MTEFTTVNTAVAHPIPIARARIASPAIDFAFAHDRQLRIRRLNTDQNDTSSGMSPRKGSKKDVNSPIWTCSPPRAASICASKPAVLTESTPIVSLSRAVLGRYRVSVTYSEQVVAHPDITPVLGNFRVAGDSGQSRGLLNQKPSRSPATDMLEFPHLVTFEVAASRILIE